MTMQKADSWKNRNKTEHEEEREKVFVPVRCREDSQEEELSQVGKDKVWEIRRRWYIY